MKDPEPQVIAEAIAAFAQCDLSLPARNAIKFLALVVKLKMTIDYSQSLSAVTNVI